MFERFLKSSSKLLNYPWLVLLAGTIITVIFALALPKIQVDNDIANMIPENNYSRKTFDEYEKIFGSSSLVFVGVESDNVFSKETFDYVRKVTKEIEELNRSIPRGSISKLLGISEDEAVQVIETMSEVGVEDQEYLKEILSDKDILADEYFWDEELAQKVSKVMASVDMERLITVFELPISDVNSISNTEHVRGVDGKFIVEPLYDEALPETRAIAMARERIDSWDLYRGGIVSYDNTLTSIMVQLDSFGLKTRTEVYKRISAILDKEKPAGITVYLDGDSVIADSINEYMMTDMSVLIPIVFIVIFLSLFMAFKRFSGVFYPLLAVLISIIWAIGLMIYLDVPLNMISTILPVLLFAVGSAYGIHFMNHYFLSNAPDRRQAIIGNVSGVGLAISMAALTTVAGFASLVSTSFVPIRHFGVFTAIGIFFALIITLYVIPSIMLLGKKTMPMAHDYKEKSPLIGPILKKISAFTSKHYKGIIAASIILFIIFGIGILFVSVEMNSITFFRKSAPIRIADDKLNEKLAGTMVLNVILEKRDGTSVIDPEILKFADGFQTEIKGQFDQIKKTISITDFLKKLNQEMYGGATEHYILPKTPEKLNDYLLLYSGNLDTVLTDEKDKMKITLSMKRGSTKETVVIKKYVNKYFTQEFLDKNNLNLVISGVADMYIAVNFLITTGQLLSLLLSLIVVFLIIIFVFKKILLSLVALIPIALTLVINFGMMGFLKIPLNAGTAMVASLAIGIGIDYAIHLIVKVKRELESGYSMERALNLGITETGRGIIYNMFSVIAGFLVLLFSRFIPLMQFGYLVSLCMLTTGIGALVILPAVLKLLGDKITCDKRSDK